MVQQTFSNPKDSEASPVTTKEQNIPPPSPLSIPTSNAQSQLQPRPISNRLKEYGKARLASVRLMAVILGGLSLCIGVPCHYQSDWTNLDVSVNRTTGKLFQVACEESDKDVICPSIVLERFFVWVAIITFILSVIMLFASIMIGFDSKPIRIFDFLYHDLAGMALLIAGILMITSAIQIAFLDIPVDGGDVRLLTGGKIVAGVLTVMQAPLCLSIIFLVKKFGWEWHKIDMPTTGADRERQIRAQLAFL